MTRAVRISSRLILAILLSLTILSCSEPAETPSEQAIAPASPPPPPDARQLHHGFDVSSHSGTVDWAVLAAAGHSFAFVKATEGQDLKDPDFDRHWPAIKNAGITRGAYHFYVTEDDPELQAQFFIDTVHLEPGAVFGPHVRGWDYDGMSLVSPMPGVSFFAFESDFGAQVGSADLDGDGRTKSS